MSCEQMAAQMLDFLYGELSGADRAAFDAHVVGCDRCRREVESLGRTRALARAALDQTEAPSARVRSSIVRAAQEAARAKAEQSQAEAKVVAKAPVIVPAARGSFWDWLRARWVFPTLATVGALSVFLLGSRLFLKPPRMQRLDAESAAVPTPAAPTDDITATRGAATPAAAPAMAAAAEPAAKSMAADDKVARARLTGASKNQAPRAAVRLSRTIAGATKGGVSARSDDRAEDADSDEARSEPISGQVSGKTIGGGFGAAVEKSRAFAPPSPPSSPPSPAAWPAPAAAKKAERKAEKAEESEDELSEGASSRLPKPASSSASSSASSAASKPAPRAQASGGAQPPAKADAPHAETLVQRADRLFAAGRWVEAAAAYRDLLRANPNDADVPRWRRRLAAAQAATPESSPERP